MPNSMVLSLSKQSGAGVLIKNDTVEERTICVQGLSVFGIDAPPANPGIVHVRANSIPAGTTHTVSAQFAAEMTAIGLDTLSAWASTGEYFCRLEWTFPGYQYPRLTSRHILVSEGTTDISFSGGFDWALKLLSYFQSPGNSPSSAQWTHQRPPEALGSTRPPPQKFLHYTSQRGSLEPVQSVTQLGASPLLPLGSQGMPFPSSSTSYPPNFGSGIFAPPALVGTAVTDPQDAREISSTTMPYCVSTQHSLDWNPDDYEENEHLGQLGSPGSLTADTTGRSTPCWDPDTEPNNEWTEDQVQSQIQIGVLEQQRREADALYAQNGDPSGHFAVLQSAAQHPGVWQPSGLPYF